jgi:Ca2+-binding EF-hand superfamily protein
LLERHEFITFCADGDGQLSGSELEAMFAELGVSTSPAEVLKLTKELDKGSLYCSGDFTGKTKQCTADGDGKVSFKEFIEGITWMKKVCTGSISIVFALLLFVDSVVRVH